MFNFLKKTKNNDTFVSPVKGKMIQLSEVNDPVFAEGMMGEGFGIIPADHSIYAPVEGDVTMSFPTGHAYGIQTQDGTEILIHLGIDTVELKGEGFEVFAKQGNHVKQGDLLCKMNLETIRANGKEDTCIVLFPGGEQVEPLKVGKEMEAKEGNIVKYSK